MAAESTEVRRKHLKYFINNLLTLLSQKEKKHLILLIMAMGVMALLDIIGVVSIMPFMAVLGNPDLIQTNAILNYFFTEFDFESNQSFLLFLACSVFFMLVISNSSKAIITYCQIRFTFMREYTIGKLLVNSYFKQPYSWFLNRNTADLSTAVLSEVNQVINQAIIPSVNLIAHSAISIAILILLIIVDPKIALVMGTVICSIYLIIYSLISKYLARIGEERIVANEHRFSSIAEAFGAIKEIKLGNLEKIYVDRFSEPASTYAKHQSSAQIISLIPRFILELTTFGGMLILILYLMIQKGEISKALPFITLYAVAGYRLLPALQQVYASISQLRYSLSAVEALCHEIRGVKNLESASNFSKRFDFQNNITLKNINFKYPKSSSFTLNNFSIEIKKNTHIGLVGLTGSGKTTTVDLLLGLLSIDEGSFFVDGKRITSKNIRGWQKNIGYVPQNIYLADDTIAANIAFGIPKADIDYSVVDKVVRIAQLSNFIYDELSDGYFTKVGERGARLSGGQLQRIGIARALYSSPEILVLDEATSALDSFTEQCVIEALRETQKNITIITIAHRLGTVRDCDEIFLLKRGEIIDKGTYDTLISSNDFFKELVGINKT